MLHYAFLAAAERSAEQAGGQNGEHLDGPQPADRHWHAHAALRRLPRPADAQPEPFVPGTRLLFGWLVGNAGGLLQPVAAHFVDNFSAVAVASRRPTWSVLWKA